MFCKPNGEPHAIGDSQHTGKFYAEIANVVQKIVKLTTGHSMNIRKNKMQRI